MRKEIKSILSVALSAAMAVSLGAVSNVASAEETTDTAGTTEAAGKHTYHAYLGFQAAGTPDWIFRNAIEDADNGINSKNYDYLTQYMNSNSGKQDATITNADITENGTYTITIDGIDLSNQTAMNMAFITTDIPLAMTGVEFTNVKYSVDGKVVATQEKGEQKYDNYDHYMMMSTCQYGNPSKKVNEDLSTVLPSKSLSITFDVKGIDFDKSYTAETVGLAKGKTIVKDGVTYKVTTTAKYTEGLDKTTNGKVQVVGVNKAAKTVKVADTIKDSDAAYTVSGVAAGTFKGASKLTAVTFGKNVKSIAKDTFVNCKKLSTVTFGAKLSSVAKDSFKGCKTVKVKGTSAAANKKLLAKQNKTVKFK
ncbi:leucine-rich repeat domain-containing protein [Eubacterium sp. MSJ-13]|uniref:leucine-rich repeat protein n=1 Tax=Eubacterium sp. MSJ-13 TaxID=2841513 RepID=UPI001C0FAA2D|nr:leucine-rich repeat protein [Eubacterium sp. MSJ-13]MBU5479387.1 leucine-rich repeat domain-containing protein [Eubacterium sp. MSJ-13]